MVSEGDSLPSIVNVDNETLEETGSGLLAVKSDYQKFLLDKIAINELNIAISDVSHAFTNIDTAEKDKITDSNGLLNTISSATSYYDTEDLYYVNDEVVVSETNVRSTTSTSAVLVETLSCGDIIIPYVIEKLRGNSTGPTTCYARIKFFYTDTTNATSSNVQSLANGTAVYRKVDNPNPSKTVDYIEVYMWNNYGLASYKDASYCMNLSTTETTIDITYSKGEMTDMYLVVFDENFEAVNVGDVYFKLTDGGANETSEYEAFDLVTGLSLGWTPTVLQIIQKETSNSKIKAYCLFITGA